MSEQLKDLQKREQFIELSQKVYPLMQQISKLLEESDFGTSASITLGREGYMEFQPYETKWRMVRYRPDDVPAARYELSELISIVGREE